MIGGTAYAWRQSHAWRVVLLELRVVPILATADLDGYNAIVYISRLELGHWKNFSEIAVDLSSRVFIAGNNGTGKSNILDALRFLRDVAESSGGGLQAAVESRGGMKCIRSMFARRSPAIKIAVNVNETIKASKETPDWRYELQIDQEKKGRHRVYVANERVEQSGKEVLSRSYEEFKHDIELLQQTALEQASMNTGFRPLRQFFESLLYVHIVPQLIRYGDKMQARALAKDPFGRNLINSIATLSSQQQTTLLKSIEDALLAVKPQFSESSLELRIERDPKTDLQHIVYRYPSWRYRGVLQDESILSDGELRLIGLMWALHNTRSVTMLEEPELSFNDGIVRQLPAIFSHYLRTKNAARVSNRLS